MRTPKLVIGAAALAAAAGFLLPAAPASAATTPHGNYSVTGSCPSSSHPCTAHFTIGSNPNNARVRVIGDCYQGTFPYHFLGTLTGSYHYNVGDTSNTASCGAVFGGSAFMSDMGFQYGPSPTTVACWRYPNSSHFGVC